jgi:hypothetical protein
LDSILVGQRLHVFFPEKETGVGGGIQELDNCHKKQILLVILKTEERDRDRVPFE